MQGEQGWGNSILYCSYEKIKTKGRWLPCLSFCVVLAYPGGGCGGMEPGALDILIVWVIVLASASWRQAGSLALVTLLVGVGLTSLVTCVGENVV